MHLLKGESYGFMTIDKVNMKIKYIIENRKGGKKREKEWEVEAGNCIKILDKATKKILAEKMNFFKKDEFWGMTEASEGASQADIWGKIIPDKEYQMQRLWSKSIYGIAKNQQDSRWRRVMSGIVVGDDVRSRRALQVPEGIGETIGKFWAEERHNVT